MADFFIEPATLTEADLPEGGDPDSQNQVSTQSTVKIVNFTTIKKHSRINNYFSICGANII